MALLKGSNCSENINAAPGSMMGSGMYLKWLYADAYGMRNKQDELEMFVTNQHYNTNSIRVL